MREVPKGAKFGSPHAPLRLRKVLSLSQRSERADLRGVANWAVFQPVSDLLPAAFEQVVDAEFISYLPHVDRLVAEARVPGDDRISLASGSRSVTVTLASSCEPERRVLSLYATGRDPRYGHVEGAVADARTRREVPLRASHSAGHGFTILTTTQPQSGTGAVTNHVIRQRFPDQAISELHYDGEIWLVNWQRDAARQETALA